MNKKLKNSVALTWISIYQAKKILHGNSGNVLGMKLRTPKIIDVQ